MVFVPRERADAALKVADLTHFFDDTTLYWPAALADRFRYYKKIETGSGTGVGSTYYTANSFCAAEHGGTHLDAPIHFAENRKTVGQIPLSQLIGKVCH